MASDTDDTACHYAKATVGHREGIHMGNCCKQSKYVWQEVNLYIESVVKGRKEPRSPNSVITHGDRVVPMSQVLGRRRNSHSSKMATERKEELGSPERPSTKHANCSCRGPWASGTATGTTALFYSVKVMSLGSYQSTVVALASEMALFPTERSHCPVLEGPFQVPPQKDRSQAM
ncbi:hypothetical protein I79_014431 [Cricetulus griseus]|uniref:Uncharacterized protein n=1 Tax=Cricetulus griseus TaxID=10029 RepID=G3HU29_CRIGR|nr:hypothetical protein I79_014431 [Cricetulus griseus]